jgi:SAM-dependent methyltransferase
MSSSISFDRPVPAYNKYPYDELLQYSHQTKMNRFPKIFESAKNLCPDPKRVLSFGCSTGEEAFTLAEQYYPDSEIIGVDIDYYSIQRARKTNKFKDRVFFHTDLGATGKYDVAFCLMVLFSLEKPIGFDKFESAIETIDKYLNQNAFLIFYTLEYNPMCVELFRNKYRPVNEWIRLHNKNNTEYYNGYYQKIKE